MDLMSSEEVQGFLKISRSTLYLWVRQKKLNPRRAGRRLLFERGEVEGLARPGRSLAEVQKVVERMRKGVISGELLPWKRGELYGSSGTGKGI